MNNSIKLAQKVFNEQAQALLKISENISEEYTKAISILLDTKGKIIVSGMGKSGHIGRKIAASLSSTGSSSFFVHPGEAYHGDLGMFQKDDTAILISYSGETDELVKIVPILKKIGLKIISITGKKKSTLAKHSDAVLLVEVEKESCPHNLAPTTSTTATLTMGDAITVTLMTLKKFKPEDFAFRHPGGSLGRQLLTTVKDLMHKKVPIVNKNLEIENVIHKMTKGKLGLVVVAEEENLVGIITDGDLRRAVENHSEKVFKLKAKDIMTINPISIFEDKKIGEAEDLMRAKHINALIVTDEEKKIVGVLQFY